MQVVDNKGNVVEVAAFVCDVCGGLIDDGNVMVIGMTSEDELVVLCNDCSRNTECAGSC